MPTVEQMRQAVQTGAMGQRRHMQMGVTGLNEINVCTVLQTHLHQIAVRQHRTFGNAGGAAGVKNPSDVMGLKLGGIHRRV